MEERRPGALNSHLLSHVRIGDEIEVWWPYDRQYYPGVVSTLLPSGRHRIDYTDGEVEDLQLSTEQWRFRGAAAARVTRALVNPRQSKHSLPASASQPDSVPPVSRHHVKSEPAPVSTSASSVPNGAASRAHLSHHVHHDSVANNLRPVTPDPSKHPPKKSIAKKRRTSSPARRRLAATRAAENSSGSASAVRRASPSPSGSRGTIRRSSVHASSTSSHATSDAPVKKSSRRAASDVSHPENAPRVSATAATSTRSGTLTQNPSNPEKINQSTDASQKPALSIASRVKPAETAQKNVNKHNPVAQAGVDGKPSVSANLNPSPTDQTAKKAQKRGNNMANNTVGKSPRHSANEQKQVSNAPKRSTAKKAAKEPVTVPRKLVGKKPEHETASAGQRQSRSVQAAVKVAAQEHGKKRASQDHLPALNSIARMTSQNTTSESKKASSGTDKQQKLGNAPDERKSSPSSRALASGLAPTNLNTLDNLPEVPRRPLAASEGRSPATGTRQGSINASLSLASFGRRNSGAQRLQSASRAVRPIAVAQSANKDVRREENGSSRPEDRHPSPGNASALRSVLPQNATPEVVSISREVAKNPPSKQVDSVQGAATATNKVNSGRTVTQHHKNVDEEKSCKKPTLESPSERQEQAGKESVMQGEKTKDGDKASTKGHMDRGSNGLNSLLHSTAASVSTGNKPGQEGNPPKSTHTSGSRGSTGEKSRPGAIATGKRTLPEVPKETKKARVQDSKRSATQPGEPLSRVDSSGNGKAIVTLPLSSDSTLDATVAKIVSESEQHKTPTMVAASDPKKNQQSQLSGGASEIEFTFGKSPELEKLVLQKSVHESDLSVRKQVVKRPRSSDERDKTDNQSHIVPMEIGGPHGLTGNARNEVVSERRETERLNLSDQQAAMLGAAVRKAPSDNGMEHIRLQMLHRDVRQSVEASRQTVGVTGDHNKEQPSSSRVTAREPVALKSANATKASTRQSPALVSEKVRIAQPAGASIHAVGSQRTPSLSQQIHGSNSDEPHVNKGASASVVQKFGTVNVSRPRTETRVAQNPEKGTASLPLDILMRTITESNIRSLQARLTPLAARIDAQFAKNEEHMKKLAAGLSSHTNQNTRLSNEQEVLRKALEQSVSKSSLISAVSALTSKIMTTVRSEMNQLAQKLHEDLLRDITAKLQDNTNLLLAKVENYHERAISAALDRGMQTVGGTNAAGRPTGSTLEEMQTSGSTDEAERGEIQKGNTSESNPFKSKDGLDRGEQDEHAQNRPSQGKMQEYEKAAVEARRLIGKAVIEWLLAGGSRDLAPKTERETAVTPSWVKETCKACLKSIYKKFEAFSNYLEAEEALEHNLGAVRIEIDWLMKGPTPEMVTRARLNYIGWDPRIHDFEWESEKRVLIQLATEVIAAEKALLAKRMRIIEPLRNATRCVKFTLSRMGGAVGW